MEKSKWWNCFDYSLTSCIGLWSGIPIESYLFLCIDIRMYKKTRTNTTKEWCEKLLLYYLAESSTFAQWSMFYIWNIFKFSHLLLPFNDVCASLVFNCGPTLTAPIERSTTHHWRDVSVEGRSPRNHWTNACSGRNLIFLRKSPTVGSARKQIPLQKCYYPSIYSI